MLFMLLGEISLRATFRCAGALGTLGLVDAAVVCFGAGGGLVSPGTKSKMGFSML